jgi:hypothetical protein
MTLYNFKVITTPVSGEVHIKENSQFNKLEADTVVVNENITARLYGSVKKTLVLKPGSVVVLHGRLHGSIKNEGGEFQNFER